MIRNLPLRQPSGPGCGTGAMQTYDRLRSPVGRATSPAPPALQNAPTQKVVALVVEPIGPALRVVQDFFSVAWVSESKISGSELGTKPSPWYTRYPITRGDSTMRFSVVEVHGLPDTVMTPRSLRSRHTARRLAPSKRRSALSRMILASSSLIVSSTTLPVASLVRSHLNARLPSCRRPASAEGSTYGRRSALRRAVQEPSGCGTGPSC